MTINIGNSSINGIYVGDTSVKSVYLGDNLVYSKQSEPSDTADSYNYFVFNAYPGSPIVFQNSRGYDTTAWDGMTDWGDGTVDTELSHKYAEAGEYTVKTKWTINDTYRGVGDERTRINLIRCTGINKNMKSYAYLFYKCSNLINLDISNLDTSKVTNMKYMFSRCHKADTFDLSGLNTSNVVDMSYMFASSSSTSLDLSSFDTSKVINMSYMFYHCSSLALLNISNWNTASVTDIKYMFNNCNSLTIDNIIMTNCNSSTKTKIQNALSA